MEKTLTPQVDLKLVFQNLLQDIDIISLTSRKYLVRRIQCEGLDFLTRTLPKLDKALLYSLQVGEFTRDHADFPLSCFRYSGRLLLPFKGLLLQIFDINGKLRTDFCPVAIWAIRQVCAYGYKLAVSFSPEQISDGEQKFATVEQELDEMSFDHTWVERLRKNFETFYPQVANAAIDDVFSTARPRTSKGAFAGSGLVADFTAYKQLPGDLIGTYPVGCDGVSGYFKPYPSAPTEPHEEIPLTRNSEVRFVPKDSRGPRVICKEPFHQLRGQMAFFDWLSAELQSVTRGRIMFTDQTVNNRLACKGSIDGSVCTIDLKDASDRVSFRLISDVTKNSPAYRYVLTHFRSGSTVLPSSHTLHLSKVAGMGSGITFPTMALLIHLSICTYVSKARSLPYNYVSKRVFVYGDDVICPSAWYTLSLRGLALSGLAVNKDKSFSRGPFRESCGGDYVSGNNITPVRLRLANCGIEPGDTIMPLDNDMRGEQVYAHYIELYKNGLLSTAEYFLKLYEAYVRKKYKLGGDYSLPYTSEASGLNGRLYWGRLSGDDNPVKVPSTSSVESVYQGSALDPYKYLGESLRRPPVNPSGGYVRSVYGGIIRYFTNDLWKERIGVVDPARTKLGYGIVPKLREVKTTLKEVPSYIARIWA